MTLTDTLLTVDEPMYGGGILFPRSVVEEAILRARKDKSGPFGMLEICRFEVLEYSMGADLEQDDMISRLSMAGQMLEIIGEVQELWIDGKELKFTGFIQDKVGWPVPLAHHKPIPYMTLDTTYRERPRVVKSMSFTEIVMAYQAVTMLSLKKFDQRKSHLAVDRKV